jgi:beta-lactamase regulating signal transducer with metallopeptidase domain
VLLAGVLAALVFQSHSSTTRYWSWNLCLLLLVLVVPLSLALPNWDLAMIAPPGYSALPPVDDVEFAGVGISARTVTELLNTDLFHTNHDLSAWEILWGSLLMVWVLGVVVLLAKLVADLISLLITSRTGSPAPTEWQTLIEKCRQRANCVLAVRVRLSDRIGSPLIWGFIRPTVLLPASALEWNEERLRMVLLHELLHAARFDHTMMVLAQLVRCVYWGNPLTWLAVHRHAIERELSCDERVINCGSDRIAYAEELVAITRDLKREVRYASVAMTQQYGLKTRIVSILEDHLSLRLLNRTSARLLTVLALVMTLSLASAKLVQEPDPESVESLVAELFGHDISLADDAARHLGEMRGEARDAVPYLIKVAGKTSIPHVRMQSIMALGKIGGKQALQGLVSMLDDKDVWTRYTAVSALEKFADGEAGESLWWAWEGDASPYVRLRAYRALAQLDKVGDPEPFLTRLATEDAELRAYAAGQLGEFCDLAAVRYHLSETDLPKDLCVQKLNWLVSNDPETEVRKSAVRSLARLDSEHLRKTLPLLDEDTRLLAEAALKEFTR